jgi:multisubunit Na+/H+ antiporter MnhB subunit
MQDQTYILGFIFVGLAFAGLLAIAAAAYAMYLHFKYKPKPTEWDKAWADIEKNLSK